MAQASSTGSKTQTSWNISVKKNDKMRALSLLNMNGLPRRKGESLLSLFQKQGLVSSEMEDKIRYQAGLAEQIAHTIRKIDGVLDADIQISFPQEESLPGQAAEDRTVTASVYVKHQGVLDNPNSHLIIKIKRLVSSAIQKLEFDNVTVIADRALFSEPMIKDTLADPDILSVWGILMVRESLFRFQALFVSMIILFILTTFTVGWMFWKLHLVLPMLGGATSLFSVSPWNLTSNQEEEEEDEEYEEEEEEEEEEE
jgi:type III secretion protein J